MIFKAVVLGIVQRLRDVVLPLGRHLSGIRFVADLIINVIEFRQGLNELADNGFLYPSQIRVPKGINFVEGALTDAIDIVAFVHWIGAPQCFLIERAEEVYFDNYASFGSLGHEIT